MTALTVMLRGIRHRAGRSLAVFVLAALTTTAAVLAPAYSRAAQQSVLTDGLAGAPPDATSLIVGARGTADAAPAAFADTNEIRLTASRAMARRPLVADRLDRPVAAVDTEVTLTAPDGPLAAKFAYRDFVCTHLRIAGSCPNSAGEVLVSQRTADEHRLKPGDPLTVHLGPRSGGRDRVFTITGVYSPKEPTEAYWGRTVYFAGTGTGGSSSTGSSSTGSSSTGSSSTGGAEADAERVDTVFTMTQEDLRIERAATLVSRLEYPLLTGQVRLNDVPDLRDGLAGLSSQLRGADLDVTTGLPDVLDQVAADQAAIGRTAPVIAVPLLLLCWFVLFLMVAAITEERAPEIALAKLRGYRSLRAARFGLGETLLLLAFAAPFGVALGLGLVSLAADTLLARGTAVELRWPVFAAAGTALAAAAVATLLAGRATLGQPVLALLRRVPERVGWRAGVTDGIVAALAAASLVAAAADRAAPLALLAAPLLAVVVGIAAARLLGLWSGLRLRLARRRGKLVPLLAAAQLSRRPGGQRVVVVVTVAVALLSFAATAWDVAAQARRYTAEDRVGAPRVLTVAADHPAALITAVGLADPDGHAMAVVRTTQRYGDAPVELLGVQADRLAEVAVWRHHSRADVAQLAGQLRPSMPAPLRLGRDIAVDVIVEALPAKPALRLSAVVAAAGQPPRSVPLGGLSKGGREYRAALPECGGCRLIGLAVGRAAGGGDPFALTLSVRALRTDGADLSAGLDVSGRWRVVTQRAPQAQATVRAGSALGIEISSADPADVQVEYVDGPDRLPVVLAGGAPADDRRAQSFAFPGFADAPQQFAVTARTTSLPRAGTSGLLFDLDYATRLAERTSSLADNATLRYEVWAGAGAPADLDRRLTANGVQVLSSESIGGYLDQLGRRAPALGLWLYLLAGGAAIALAVGAVLFTAYVGVSGRLYELAALRVVGVRSGVLRRAVFREYRAVLGLPLLVGLAAGIAGAAVMLPGIPLVTVGEPTGAVTYRPGLGALPVAAGVSVLGLLVAVLMVARLLGRATPDRLREGNSR